MKSIIKLLPAVLLIFVVALSGCDGDQNNSNDQITKNGIILLLDGIDSCNDYVIEIDNHIYKPENLNSVLKKDSLKVKLTYKLKSSETYNCGFAGYIPVIRIVNIETLPY